MKFSFEDEGGKKVITRIGQAPVTSRARAPGSTRAPGRRG